MHKATRHLLLAMTVLTCTAMLFTVLANTTSAAYADTTSETASTQTVRVGIVEQKGYIEPDAEGNERGYDADYTMKIAQYAHLDVKWVVEDNYAALLNDLEAGNIDMAPGVSKSGDREERFIFSDSWLGRGNMSILVRADDDSVNFGDIDALSAKRFGVLAGSSMGQALLSWGQSHGFTPRMTEYESNESMTLALQMGQIDAIAYGGSPAPDGARVVAQFNPTSYYMVFAKDNIALKTAVDGAMTRILSEDSNYEQKLYRKYRASLETEAFAFTAQEKAYLANHSTLSVAMLKDNLPYSKVTADGTARGIIPDYYRELENCCGVSFEFVGFDTLNEEKAALAAGTIDIAGLVSDDVFDANSSSIVLTSDYTELSAVMLKRVNTRDVSKAAVLTAEKNEITRQLTLNGSDIELMSFDSVDTCFNALQNGQVDAVISSMPSGTWLLNQHRTSEYSLTSMDNISWGVCGAAARDNDVLASILSKANSASHANIEGIIATNTLPEQNLTTFIDRLPVSWIVAISVITILIILFLAIVILRTRRQREQATLATAEAGLRAAQEARRAESEFLSSMSHDMRTPLNGIIGFTGLALEDESPTHKQEYLGKIKTSSNLMLSLVNDVLDLSKIESGKMELSPEVYPVKATFQSVVDPVRIAAEEARVVFTFEDPDDISNRYIRGDKLRTQQVMLNLLSNAVKYTPAGGSVNYALALLDPPQDGCNVEARISDTGKGMSEEFQKKMYDPFSQERANGRTAAQGTGLGLSIVKRIIELMGGTIAVQSALDEGTTFTVRLPVEFVEPTQDEVRELHNCTEGSIPGANEATSIEADARKAAADLQGLHVLLVEDNEVNAEVAKTMLKKRLNAIVDIAPDGEQGLDAFAASPPGYFDAILMDVRMPVMNGMDASCAIRALNRSDAAEVPILAMTADVFANDVKACLEAGMNGHIGKPVDADQLLEALDTFVKRPNN